MIMILELIKSLFKKNAVYRLWFNFKVERKRAVEVDKWVSNGMSLPPPHAFKQLLIIDYAAKFALRNFVETGTFLGYMVEVMQYKFHHLFSIELDTTLYERAKWKFRKSSNITILQGDSSAVLPVILAGIKEPALFWLDGHYSGGVTAKGAFNTPIVSELRSILDHPVKQHVILVDDARCFVGNDDYPTIEELRSMVMKYDSSLHFHVENDIVIIHK